MRSSSTTSADQAHWPLPSYEVRVRGTIFLWGSAGLTQNMTFKSEPVLHLRNDTFGEAISFGTRLANGTQTTLGSLQPGECVSVPLEGISGVFATCTAESSVCCVIKH